MGNANRYEAVQFIRNEITNVTATATWTKLTNNLEGRNSVLILNNGVGTAGSTTSTLQVYYANNRGGMTYRKVAVPSDAIGDRLEWKQFISAPFTSDIDIYVKPSAANTRVTLIEYI